jgi:hypothetical protein
MRDSYIQAVLCLAKKPSRIGLNTTLYDDFSWVHMTLFDESMNIESSEQERVLTKGQLIGPLLRSYPGIAILSTSTKKLCRTVATRVMHCKSPCPITFKV